MCHAKRRKQQHLVEVIHYCTGLFTFVWIILLKAIVSQPSKNKIAFSATFIRLLELIT